ncbi:retrovirus-related pol polyprotein from transposon TNT 1-94 [Tanacetum coccineum]
MNDNVSKYNNNSIFSINKKRKLDLNSSYLWHCRFAHIGKTRMQKLQREGLLESINDGSYDKCESCISGKMIKKPFNNNIERATDLLHKFPAIIFNDGDIEERTSRWVNKCVKKFNPYARYGVEHWKNPHAKIFYIRKQKEPGKAKEVVYSNSKIIQVIKTYWELGHEHKFITEIVARRANECIVSIIEPDFKNLNKNDIEDMYLLIMNGKVPDYAETGLLWSLSVFIRSLVIWERVHDFQLGVESYQ